MMDSLLLKKYDDANYNCSHFVVDAWKMITGIDISDLMLGFMAKKQDRKMFSITRRTFKEVDYKGGNPLLVLMSKPNYRHIGVLYNRKVLHIQKTGVEYLNIDIASRGFNSVRFFKCLR